MDRPMLTRRALLLAGALAASAGHAAPTRLDREQSQRFRDWMTLLIHAQIERGPTPRWTHRDCAGLVRFAVAESLREHDLAWKRANGLRAVRADQLLGWKDTRWRPSDDNPNFSGVHRLAFLA